MSKLGSFFIKFTLLVFFFCFILGAGTVGGYLWLGRPVNPNNTNQIKFTVTKGQGVNTIGTNLYKAGLIRHSLLFRLMAYQTRVASTLQAGNFTLSTAMSLRDITLSLTSAQDDQVRATLLEGWRREEMADALQTVFAKDPNFSETEFIALTKNLEGQLFPETYFFPTDASTSAVIKTLTNHYQTVKSKYPSNKPEADILAMASIIEREAKGDDRFIVSGILWKRIANNWPLQVDASLQYAKGYNKKEQTWWAPPLGIDRDIDSPYNTYKNLGLPPGPICNPSELSINAAANPKDSEYWFYITGNDGQMYYAKTQAEHDTNVAKYLH